MGNRVQLSTMEDIAGARAVVPTVHELRRLEQQWLRRPTYPIERHRDYIESPRSSGYRAVHLVMRHKGRLVEVQLRTKLQNEWADLVEDLGHATGSALKNQEGPPELIANLASLADEVAVVDSAPQRYADAWRLTLERIAEVRAKVRSSKGDDDV